MGTLQYAVLLVGGALLGIVLGAIPGISATMAVALIIPFTFGMPIISAMELLLGIYAGSIYGGSIPAILFKTPGTPASAAVVFDGYALMRRGEAGRALGIAAVSMLIGGLIGAVLLVFLAPQISAVALKFGPSEFFAMAVFGILVIVSVSEESFFKTMLAALAGLLLSCVGMDPLSGYPRFIFGASSLMEGMPFIPVLIGLFAVAGVFGASDGCGEGCGEKTDVRVKFCEMPTARDMKKSLWTMIKSGFVGSFIGSTPGAGCDIASFVSYAVARNGAKAGDEFGKGEIKGIAAVESAKAGCTSGALIPLLSLGIPGDSVTAILVGAFIVHGIAPGPLLFENSPDVAWTIFFTVLLVQIAVFVMALMLVKWAAAILKIDPRFIKASILALSAVGAFAMRNNVFDVWVAFAFGILGVFFQKWKVPVAPFLLALILGSMAEVNFRRASVLNMNSLSFMWERPITLGILLAAAAFVAFGLFKKAAKSG